MESIETKLREFIAENLLFSNNGYPFPDDTSFLENGTVDSMSVMEIVLYTEQTFGIAISDDEIVPANFDSIHNLATYIREKLAPAQPGQID